MGLFMGSLFCSIDLYVFSASTTLFFFLAVQGLHCHVGFSLVSVNGGFSLVHGLLIAMGSFVLKHRLQDTWASVLSAHGLSSCHSQILEHRLNSCGTWA